MHVITPAKLRKYASVNSARLKLKTEAAIFSNGMHALFYPNGA